MSATFTKTSLIIINYIVIIDIYIHPHVRELLERTQQLISKHDIRVLYSRIKGSKTGVFHHNLHSKREDKLMWSIKCNTMKVDYIS